MTTIPQRELRNNVSDVLRRAEPKVRIAGGDALSARIAGVDVDGDIAVLAVDTGSAPPLTWATTSRLGEG